LVCSACDNFSKASLLAFSASLISLSMYSLLLASDFFVGFQTNHIVSVNNTTVANKWDKNTQRLGNSALTTSVSFSGAQLVRHIVKGKNNKHALVKNIKSFLPLLCTFTSLFVA
jgi:hypothetical protein